MWFPRKSLYEISKIHRGDAIIGEEKGVSVYDACFKNNKWNIIMPTPMKELDIQNRNLIYMLNIGDIFETKDYRGNTIKGEIVAIDNYYKRSIYDSHTGIITWKDSLEYPEPEVYTDKDIRYIQWKDGSHWYVKIGKYDVVDENGNQKWNTRNEAINAAYNYLKELNKTV